MTIESDSIAMSGQLAEQNGKPDPSVDPGTRKAQIAKKLAAMPESCRATYKRAMSGKSRLAGVKAHCQECFCYSEYRANVRDCTITTCPLWPYRPYRSKT